MSHPKLYAKPGQEVIFLSEDTEAKTGSFRARCDGLRNLYVSAADIVYTGERTYSEAFGVFPTTTNQVRLERVEVTLIPSKLS